MCLEKLLQVLSNRYEVLLGSHLTGIYVHGSIAFGCFSWARSDIDFIVVVDEPLAEATKLHLLAVLEDLHDQAPPKGFEMSVVLEEHCRLFAYPTPYELHFSNGWRDPYLADPRSLCDTNRKTDIDLAAHFTVINKVGIPLYGRPVAKVFGPVPHQDYLDSILADVAQARQDVLANPVYVILNLCRVLAYVKDRQVLSKAQGGHWGMTHLSEPGRSIVRQALAAYSGEPADFDLAQSDLLPDFCSSMLEVIKADVVISNPGPEKYPDRP